jgi:biotin operon repressor
MAKGKSNPRRRSVAWSKVDVRMLKALAKAKFSGTAVAKKLKRSRGAVAQKAMKLGVRFRSVRRKGA